MKNVTLLIDGSNLVWRTYYVAESINAGGEDGLLHVHMFLSALKNYIDLYKPNKIICCWDKRAERHSNFRTTMLSEYKEQRDKDKAKEVHVETGLIEELVGYLGIAHFYPRQLEADDCIAWLCDTLPGRKIVVSSDKDMLQLVNDDVVFYDPMKKVEINMSNFDVYSKHAYNTFLVEKCFAGDRSDNVPGIRGFGPVKVKKYLAGEIELTDEQKEQLKLNEELFRLDLYKDVPDEVDWYESQNQHGTVDWDMFLKLCENKGLNSIIKNKENWYSTFAMDIKLSNMFENLFG